jgi:hypothetical protein
MNNPSSEIYKYCTFLASRNKKYFWELSCQPNYDTYQGQIIMNIITKHNNFITKYGIDIYLQSDLLIQDNKNEIQKYNLETFIHPSLLLVNKKTDLEKLMIRDGFINKYNNTIFKKEELDNVEKKRLEKEEFKKERVEKERLEIEKYYKDKEFEKERLKQEKITKERMEKEQKETERYMTFHDNYPNISFENFRKIEKEEFENFRKNIRIKKQERLEKQEIEKQKKEKYYKDLLMNRLDISVIPENYEELFKINRSGGHRHCKKSKGSKKSESKKSGSKKSGSKKSESKN